MERKYISSNNLIITHQVIIPKSEIKRLLDKFEIINEKIQPNVVILDKNGFIKLDIFENDNFCLIFDNKTFSIYVNKEIIDECGFVKN